MNEQKICFITCVNNERYYAEQQLYLQNLLVPAGFEIEYRAIRGASSMTSGYNQAMNSSDAKYKIYLHQDVFMVQRDCLQRLVDKFRSDKRVGCVGLCGAAVLPPVSIWWEGQEKYGEIYHRIIAETITHSIYGRSQQWVEVLAADGLFMATQEDLPWREDLFTNWHFYDISQCMEFRRQGYKVMIPPQTEPWLVHFCGNKVLGRDYEKNRQIFISEYRRQKGADGYEWI